MKVRIKGKHSKLTNKEVRSAVRFMSSLIMSSKMSDNLRVSITFCDNLFYDNQDHDGDVVWTDRRSKPRSFSMRLSTKMRSRKQVLMVLGHELTHIKQYARGELKDCGRGPSVIKWKAQDYSKLNYYDQPWEIEAAGRELGLYVRFKDYLRENNICFGKTA